MVIWLYIYISERRLQRPGNVSSTLTSKPTTMTQSAHIDTIITVFQVCTKIFPSAIVLTFQAWSTLIEPRQYLLVQTESKANIVLISFFYYIILELLILIPAWKLQYIIYYKIFTFLKVCIT